MCNLINMTKGRKYFQIALKCPGELNLQRGGSLQPKNFLNLTNYFQPLLIYSPKNSPGSAVEIFSAIYPALSIYCVQITVFLHFDFSILNCL